jgi:hypothetical protein
MISWPMIAPAAPSGTAQTRDAAKNEGCGLAEV